MNHNILAKLARDSYHYATFSVGECEALIKYYDNVQVIAFRGTEACSLTKGVGFAAIFKQLFKEGGIRDIWRDIRLMPWYDKDTGWCHSGFIKGGRRSADFLSNHLVMDVPVVCTGHSLGGALSLMCAVKLQAMGFDIQEWVGFASPKCQLTSKKYTFKQTNYRHRADIVPLMPRNTPYRHNCDVIWLQPNLDLAPTWADHPVQFYVHYVL